MASPYTWPGILEHMVGIRNHSGHNGLATFRATTVGAFGFQKVDTRRYYGGRQAGQSFSLLVMPGRVHAGVLELEGGGGVEIEKHSRHLEAFELKAEGKISLLGVVKGAYKAARPAMKKLSWIRGHLDGMMRHLERLDFFIAGEFAIQIGVTHGGFVRLCTGGSISLAVGGHEKQGSFGRTSGRSWQLLFEHGHWRNQIP